MWRKWKDTKHIVGNFALVHVLPGRNNIYTHHTHIRSKHVCVCVFGRYLCRDVRHRYIEFNWISGNRQSSQSFLVRHLFATRQPRRIVHTARNHRYVKLARYENCLVHIIIGIIIICEHIPYIQPHSWRVNIQRRHFNIRTTNHMVWLHMRHDDTTATTTSPRTQIGVMRQFFLLFFSRVSVDMERMTGGCVVNWVWKVW